MNTFNVEKIDLLRFAAAVVAAVCVLPKAVPKEVMSLDRFVLLATDGSEFPLNFRNLQTTIQVKCGTLDRNRHSPQIEKVGGSTAIFDKE